MTDDTALDPVAVGATEKLQPAPLAWSDDEPEEISWLRLRIDGRLIPAALAAS